MKKIALRISLVFFQLTIAISFNIAQNYSSTSQEETGVAMYYADYLNGQSTALGEIYNKYELTCSHKYHPKGTLLKVTRLDNNKTVTVRVNDRGTFDGNVIIDLSWAAALDLDLIKLGKAWVKVEVAGYSNLNPAKTASEQSTQPGLSNYDAPQNNPQLTVKGLYNDYYKNNNNTTNPNNTSNKPTWNNLTVKDPYATTTPPSYDTQTRSTSATTALSSGYGIQIGSYTVYDNAERLVENMRNAGVNNTYVKESYGSNGTLLYRVVIGSFSSRADATSYLQRLRTSYVADGIVVTLGK
ncbi:MAG: septal ring lytic transglycosylase RlpA family protein [Saprospiraceae bacterium]|nr:septal ring lytic transglycosylase RlpA family protein [Saprospiraceae bacterium]